MARLPQPLFELPEKAVLHSCQVTAAQQWLLSPSIAPSFEIFISQLLQIEKKIRGTDIKGILNTGDMPYSKESLRNAGVCRGVFLCSDLGKGLRLFGIL